MEEKYRVSLEIAKRLKDAGFPQDGCNASWCKSYGPPYNTNPKGEWNLQDDCEENEANSSEVYAAPCVGRLGDELPDSVNNSRLNFSKYNGKFICEIVYIMYPGIYNESEADARALMWLELKEGGLL